MTIKAHSRFYVSTYFVESSKKGLGYLFLDKDLKSLSVEINCIESQ